MPPTGTCPTCGRTGLRLTRSGSVKSHRTITDDGRFPLCDGGKPAPTPGDPR